MANIKAITLHKEVGIPFGLEYIPMAVLNDSIRQFIVDRKLPQQTFYYYKKNSFYFFIYIDNGDRIDVEYAWQF